MRDEDKENYSSKSEKSRNTNIDQQFIHGHLDGGDNLMELDNMTSEDAAAVDKAALKIQASYRGFSVRKKMSKTVALLGPYLISIQTALFLPL